MLNQGRERIPPPESDPLIQATGTQITICPIPQHCLQMAKTPCTSALILISSQPHYIVEKWQRQGGSTPALFFVYAAQFLEALSSEISPLSSLSPGGTSLNIQNPIPYKSQKTGFSLETTRAKECQRGTAQAKESTKEGGRVPAEGIDTHLGA